MVTDNEIMRLALQEAEKGWPRVAPNPMVGCVITRKGLIVAVGYHRYFGGPHAEVEAVNRLPAGINPADCTLYVTLEPCSHHGKTPPCTELLIQKGFKRVIVGVLDPNALVAGKGIAKLKAAGIDVKEGLLTHEIKYQNRRFMTFHEQKRPYLILKWAVSADGFISRDPVPAARSKNLITRGEVQKYVHQLRAESEAIMVGKNTVLSDNPSLTTRLVPGKNPVRIIIDKNLELPYSLQIFNNEAETWIYNSVKDEKKANLSFFKFSPETDFIDFLMADLFKKGIQTLLVEGGTKLLSSFIEKGLWDEAFVFQNPDLRLGKGIHGPVFPLKNTFELVGEDKLFHHFKNETFPAKGALSREIF